MGCNSSTTASSPGAAGGKKGIVPGTVKYSYFDVGYGRADPLEQMFSHHGQPHEKDSHALGAPTVPQSEFGGGLPQIIGKVGGKDVHYGQFAAMMRTFGIRYGYYDPKNWKLARYTDPIVDTWGDLIGAFGAVAFNQDESKKQELVEKWIAVATRFMAFVEKNMAHHGGKFAAGNQVTIADFVLCSFFGNFVKNPKNPTSPMLLPLLDPNPKLKAYAMSIETNFPHLKNRGEQQYPM